MVCSWQAGRLRVPREAREGLAPQDNPRVEVQEQDLGRDGGLKVGLAQAHGPPAMPTLKLLLPEGDQDVSLRPLLSQLSILATALSTVHTNFPQL